MNDRPIEDLITTVRAAYAKLDELDPGWAGKSSDGVVEVSYPSIWDKGKDPTVPNHVVVWSYALGPSREHIFSKGDAEQKKTYYHWVSPTPITRAIAVVEDWASEIRLTDEEPL